LLLPYGSLFEAFADARATERLAQRV
jgi:hypothetical protein